MFSDFGTGRCVWRDGCLIAGVLCSGDRRRRCFRSCLALWHCRTAGRGIRPQPTLSRDVNPKRAHRPRSAVSNKTPQNRPRQVVPRRTAGTTQFGARSPPTARSSPPPPPTAPLAAKRLWTCGPALSPGLLPARSCWRATAAAARGCWRRSRRHGAAWGAAAPRWPLGFGAVGCMATAVDWGRPPNAAFRCWGP